MWKIQIEQKSSEEAKNWRCKQLNLPILEILTSGILFSGFFVIICILSLMSSIYDANGIERKSIVRCFVYTLYYLNTLDFRFVVDIILCEKKLAAGDITRT